jgi:peptidyl-dipeptidase Dcp
MLKRMSALIASGAITVGTICAPPTLADANFGPSNPFYAQSTLPFHAPPFDKIKDEDYQPAIEAGMAEQIREMQAIAENPATPTFGNTLVAMEKTGQLFQRATAAFDAVSGANTDPLLQKVRAEEAPRRAAHDDAIYLNAKLFSRVAVVYKQRGSLKLDPESLRLLEVTYDKFVRSGANLSDADKAELKKLNEELSTLSNAFTTKLLAATKDGAYVTTDQSALAGLSEAQVAAAAQAAKSRKQEGYVLPLQNTTQQPELGSLSVRATREAVFEKSWNRAEHSDANDTRDIISRMAQLRARRAQLLGYPDHAAWKLGDQMVKTPEAALKFMDALVPSATAKAVSEGKDIQDVIDAQKGGFTLQPWDWDFYSEQVRKAKYDLNEAEVKPYFELNNVLENGVFYAAEQLYGITFKERKDIPVYHPDVRVFEVSDADGKPLALFYCDYFKRDNKNGGAWMSNFVNESKLLGMLPVVFNVANLPKPAPGEPALISFTDVTAMFHEFGHALNGMFANTEYPSLSGTATARDFVEFPSQFNEHWALYPAVFIHYAKHYKTGAAMPPELAAKVRKAQTFNQGYKLTELLAAAELDMQWHTLPAGEALQQPDALMRANGDRFRQMVLSRGNTEDLVKMYAAWRGKNPSVEPMMKYRGLRESDQ